MTEGLIDEQGGFSGERVCRSDLHPKADVSAGEICSV